MKQYQIRSMLIGCMLLCLTGCTANSEKKRDVLRVGVVLYTQDDPFINALTDCLKEDLAGYESDSFKVIMTVRDGKNDQKIQNEVVKEMLDAKDRTQAGQTAPPQGLTLMKIEYL